MAKLTAAQRKRIPEGKFGVFDKRTGQGKYPINDASHAANAKARATQMVNAGKLSESAREQIDAKANKVLKK